MPTITDQAICIRHWDFSETSQTVSLFARHHGVIRGLAKGAKRPTASFSGGIDLLTLGEIVAIVKPNRDLATLTAWHLERVFWSLRSTLAANRAGMYAADLINRMVSPDDPHPDLFDALVAALDALDRRADHGLALLAFQWRLLEETGYRPRLGRDADTNLELDVEAETFAFSPRAGGFVADTGEPDRWRVRRETLLLLRGVAGGTPEDTDSLVVGRANRLLATYIRELLGEHPPSMRWAFPDLPG